MRSAPSSFARIHAAGLTAVDRPAFREALDALPPDRKGDLVEALKEENGK